VPRPYSSCRGLAFSATAIFLCCGIVLCAAAMLFMQRQENDAPQHCMAFCAMVSSCVGKKQPAAAFRSMRRHYCSCRGVVYSKKQHAAACCAVVLRSAARNHALLRFVTLRVMVCRAVVRKKNNQPVWLWWPWPRGGHGVWVASLILWFLAAALCIPPQRSAA